MDTYAGRPIIILLVLLTLTLPALAPSAAGAAAPPWRTLVVGQDVAHILRDAYGVPHIFAATDRALFYAYGYAAATDRLWQMDVYRRTARGSLAEVLGPTALASDRHERLYGYPEAEYQGQFAQLPAEVQAILSAYRDGVNAYLAEAVTDPVARLPWEFHQLGYAPTLWETTDTLAIGRFMANRFGASGGNELHLQAVQQFLIGTYGAQLGAAMFEDLHWLNDPDAPTSAPGASAPGPAAARIATQRPPLQLPDVDRAAEAVAAAEEAARAVWSAYGVPVKLGSYAWAVSPARSATGHALLYGGPQMGFETPDVIHEVQLTGGQGYDAMGVGFAGVPLIFIGHNRHVAWSITSGMGDNGDIFVERLAPGETDRYWHDGAWRTMITRTETIRVAGRTTPVTKIIRESVHGPIIFLDAEHDLAYALRQAQR
ncbi:MAG: penicillin acylase family protein, partial [Chloroflexota bacterium]